MAEIASLGLAVDSSQVEKGTIALTGLSGAAAKAEAAAAGLKGSAQAAAASAHTLTGATQMEARALDAATAAAKLNKLALDAQAAAARGAAMNAKQLSFQLIDIGQGIPLLFQSPIYGLQNLGFQIAQIGQLYMGRGGLNAAIKDSAGQVGRFATGVLTRFPLITAATVAAASAFAGMTYEINRTSDVSVSFGNVIQASVQVAVDSIEGLLKPAVDAIAPWFATAWDAVTSGVKVVGNTIINSFRAVFSDLTFIFTKFPEIVAAGIGGAANMVLATVESMLNFASNGINSLIEKVNAALEKADAVMPGNGFRLGTIGQISLGRVETGGGFASANAAHAADIADIMSSDPLGQYFDAVKAKAVELASASKDAGKALKDAASGAVDPWDGLRKVSEGVKEQMRELARQARETARFWSGTAKGFVDDFTSGLEQGKSAWASFADAGVNALKRIADKLLDQAFEGLFGGNSGGLFGGLFGGGGSALNVFPGGGSLNWFGGLWAKGGAFPNGISGHSNTIVNRPTPFMFAKGAGIMGEAGPEGILPLRRNSQGQLGVIAAGAANNNQPANYNDNRVYNIDARGAQQGVGEEIKRAIMEYDREVLPTRVNQIAADPRARG